MGQVLDFNLASFQLAKVLYLFYELIDRRPLGLIDFNREHQVSFFLAKHN